MRKAAFGVLVSAAVIGCSDAAAPDSGPLSDPLDDLPHLQQVALLSHESKGASAVAFSPDGQLIAAAWLRVGSTDDDYYPEVRVWRTGSWQEVVSLEYEPKGQVNSVAFSPDGKWLAASGWHQSTRGLILVWDVETWELVVARQYPITSWYIAWDVAFSPDSRHLAVGTGDSLVRVFRTDTWNVEATLTGYPSPNIRNVKFSPDGVWLATLNGDERSEGLPDTKLWSVEDWRLVTTLRGHSLVATAAAFSPDGRLLATGANDTSVKLWAVGSWQEVAAYNLRQPVWDIAFSPDGRWIVFVGPDQMIVLGEVHGVEVRLLPEERASGGYVNGSGGGYVNEVVFSPDGEWVATAEWLCDQERGGCDARYGDDAVKVWRIENP